MGCGERAESPCQYGRRPRGAQARCPGSQQAGAAPRPLGTQAPHALAHARVAPEPGSAGGSWDWAGAGLAAELQGEELGRPLRLPKERSMSATRAKKVKMATKSCPECDQQVGAWSGRASGGAGARRWAAVALLPLAARRPCRQGPGGPAVGSAVGQWWRQSPSPRPARACGKTAWFACRQSDEPVPRSRRACVGLWGGVDLSVGTVRSRLAGLGDSGGSWTSSAWSSLPGTQGAHGAELRAQAQAQAPRVLPAIRGCFVPN